jgi:hypothetical protein
MTIADVISRIKQQAQTLNAKTDELNAAIERVESTLRESSPGVEFWWHRGHGGCLLGEETYQDDGHRWKDGYILGYARVGDEWCLAVQFLTGIIDGDTWDEVADGDAVPLKRAARRLRIEAIGYLKEFLDALSGAIDKMTEAIDRAVVVANDELPESTASKPRVRTITNAIASVAPSTLPTPTPVATKKPR